MADARAREQLRHAVHHAEPGPEDRHHDQLAAADPLARHALQRSLDLDVLDLEVARNLVGHQRRDLVHQLLEELLPGSAVTQVGELVEDERVLEDGEVGEIRAGLAHAHKIGGPGVSARDGQHL